MQAPDCSLVFFPIDRIKVRCPRRRTAHPCCLFFLFSATRASHGQGDERKAPPVATLLPTDACCLLRACALVPSLHILVLPRTMSTTTEEDIPTEAAAAAAKGAVAAGEALGADQPDLSALNKRARQQRPSLSRCAREAEKAEAGGKGGG